MKKLIPVVVILLTLAMLFTSCEQKLATYSSDAGISLQLPSGMMEVENVNFTYMVQGTKVIFMANKELKTTLEGYASDIDSYIKLLEAANSATYEVKNADGIKYFTYEATTDRDYFYLAAVIESSDAFWLCNFACLKSDQAKYETQFIEWAKTITVS